MEVVKVLKAGETVITAVSFDAMPTTTWLEGCEVRLRETVDGESPSVTVRDVTDTVTPA